jgi:putative membrane protein
MHLIIRLLINAIAFYLIALYVPGFHVASFTAAIIAALIFGIVNAIVRPLVLLLTLPFTIVTLGLFIFVVNALMIWLTAWLSPGVKIDGFVPALIGAVIMMVVGYITNHLFKSASESRAVQRT